MTFIVINRYHSYFSNHKRRTYPIVGVNIFNGLELGIPLNIISNVYTNIHYGYDITSVKTILLQFLLGYYTYGKDRYNDAIDFVDNPYNTSKEEFYKLIYNNKNIYYNTIILSFIGITYILLDQSTTNDILYNIPFLPLCYINGEYKYFKKHLYIYKSLYISIMWTFATVIIPCVLYEHNYNILYYPNDYLPCLLTLLATSNFADTKDIDEDKINNINTLPVLYGKNISNLISFIAIICSTILFIENPNFDNRLIINSGIELQNFGIMALLYNNTFLT